MNEETSQTKAPAIDIENLQVVYKSGAKSTVAVDELSLKVSHGEVFGFLGPNGAGKSTTLKALLGFVFPTKGSARLLGREAGSIEARRKLGYLPEVAVYYPYLKAKEFLWMYGRVQGIGKSELEKEIPELLDKVGLNGKENVLLKSFSKGMLQRVGLAQALLGDPDLFIFDEPASGLDPLGRRDLRQVITELKDRGKTIFFSSHELSEVELICHRFAILKAGKVIKEGNVDEMIQTLDDYRITFIPSGPISETAFDLPVQSVQGDSSARFVVAKDKKQREQVLRSLVEKEWEIVDVKANRPSLEDYFVNIISRAQSKGEVE